ncbi:hypothetical protein OK016_13265 [Vibrio chagasii]|nr:hypothetical protein [Vibrio chagasii]
MPPRSSVASDDSGINLTQAISFGHTMTPFSPAAFTQGDESHVLSYAKEWLPATFLTVPVSAVVNSIVPWMTICLGATYPLELDLDLSYGTTCQWAALTIVA